MQAEVVPVDLWQRLSEFIAQNTGLHFPAERRPDLQRGLEAAAAEFGFADGTSCARLAVVGAPDPAATARPGESPHQSERLTFSVSGRPSMRWPGAYCRSCCSAAAAASNGCACGARPAARERRRIRWRYWCSKLLPDWRDWDVTILATDINEQSLQKAAAGVYGEWSFRDCSSGFKERYFSRAADGRLPMAPQIRQCVRFAHMNLAQEGSFLADINTGAMDVIFCRNVLIYFTAAHARKLVENLRRSLAEEGWLVVSPSECSQALFSQFVAVNFPGSILYRKDNAEAGPSSDWAPPSFGTPPAQGAATAFDPPHPSVAALANAPGPEQLSAVPEQALPAAAESSQTFALQARALANQGRHADALVWCERWIAADKIDCAAHYVHATVLQEMGERETARRSLQRAIYLQPDFALAHFALGNTARAAARAAEADKHFANALEVLRDCPPDALLPESDGLTAGRLAEIITTLRARPDRAGYPGGAPT